MTDSFRENSAVNALDLKQSVRAATTANITLSGAQTIDGVSVVAGNRVLVKDQTTASQNGVYVAAAGSWSRALDANESYEVTSNFMVFVEEGTANADSGWMLTTNSPITLGSTGLTFTRITGVPSSYVGQNTITTLGTVTTGTWNATTIAVANGGTGATTAAGALTNLGAASSAHVHGNITNAGAIGSTANLPVITTTSGVLTAGSFGSSANTFCQGNDSRLSDARTPTSHVHGNITNAGAIGSTANLPVITTTSGVLTTGSFGSSANTFCQGNDSRLSDTRTPTDGTVTTAKIVDSNVTYAKIQNVSATDRLLGRSSAGAGVVEEITCTSFGRSLIDDADSTAARSTLGLVIGTNVQAYSATLAAVAGGTYTGSNTITTLGTIATGVWNGTAIAVANGGTGTTTGSITGSGTLAFTAGGTNTNVALVPNGTGTVDVSSKKITSLATPTEATDAATKAYVDSVVKTISFFTASQGQPTASTFAQFDTRNSVMVLDFDAATNESTVFVGVIPAGAILSNGLKVRINWTAATATSGDCMWTVQFEWMNTDIDADSFAGGGTNAFATNATSGVPNISEITITTIDSLSAGDFFRLKVTRLASDGLDTMAGDAELIAVSVEVP